MVKIDDFSAARAADAAFFAPAKTETKKNGRAKKLFSVFLKSHAPEDSPESSGTALSTAEIALAGRSAEDALTILLDNVHEAGDTLAKRPFPGEIKRYRLAIQNFMRYVLANAYGVKEEEGLPNYLKTGFNNERYKRDPELRKARNKYSSVQIIDQKLDRLAADIMTGQVKHISLLKNIEEINGLLVDLLE
jgi:uncharacterized protein YaaR (DUF327 family)